MCIAKLILTFAILFLFACQPSIRFASKPTQAKTTENTEHSPKDKASITDPIRATIVDAAYQMIGKPYCYGGESPDCFDCSGLVWSIYADIGKSLPRTAATQFKAARKLDRNEVLPGDLVFFSKGKGISHVGIYTGNNEIVHASTSMGVIKQSLDDSYLKKTLAGFGSLLD